MTTFMIWAGTISAFMFSRELTGVHITQYFEKFIQAFLGIVSKKARDAAINNKRKIDTMSVLQRKKSKLYRYYSFVNEILLDMNWKQRGVTVEGLTAVVFLGTCIVCTAGFVVLQNLFLVLITSALAFVMILAFMFLMSRVGHRRRKKLLIQAEDLLCSSISVGLVKCVEDNLKQIPYELQSEFQTFLDQYTMQNMPIEKAVNNLNNNLGSKFDKFCDKAINFEKSGANKGMQDLFRYNIEENSFTSELDMMCEVAFADMNMDFFASTCVIMGYVFFTITSVPFVGAFYTTGFGKAMIIIYAVILCVGFIYTQWLQSANFEFEGRI